MGSHIIVLYTSRTGYTERYAQWLGDSLDAPVCKLKAFTADMAEDCAVILCGGGIYGDELDGIRKYKRLQKQFPDKQFLYFATGLRPVSERTEQRLIAYNFGPKAQVELCYFQGGLDLEHLEQSHKTLLTLFRAMLRRKRELSPEDTAMLQLLSVSGDYSNRDQIAPMLDRLHGAYSKYQVE